MWGLGETQIYEKRIKPKSMKIKLFLFDILLNNLI